MNAEQKSQHNALLSECLANRRTSIVGELRDARARLARVVRVAGRDPVFGRQEIADRHVKRIAELQIELQEVDDRLAAAGV